MAMQKAKNYLQSIPWSSLRDLRTLGQIIFVVIVLMISWSGVKTIQSNYELQKQVATLQQQDQVQELENDNLELQNDYYSTNQYLELSARQELGLGEPGETELLVPKDVAMAALAAVPGVNQVTAKPQAHQSVYESNFEAWMDYFLHRQNTN
jgi:cell division protein FtsL